MEQKQNIILITIDCLRADYCGWLNSEHKDLTPFLNKLAKESIVFTRAYATGPFTALAMPSILTGTYTLGTKNLDEKIPLEIHKKHYLPEILHNNGYFNVFIHNNAFLSRILGYDRGFDIFKDLGDFPNNEIEKNKKLSNTKYNIKSIKLDFFKNLNMSSWSTFLKNILRGKTPKIYNLLKFLKFFITYQASASKFTDFTFITPAETINKEALKEMKKLKNPFFFWTHYLDPHEPYRCPKLSKKIIFSILSKEELKQIKIREKPLNFSNLTPENHRLIEKLYQLNIKYTDQQIELLFNNFGDKIKNSIIIVVSDHGQEFGEYGDWGHGPSKKNDKLHKEILHVPLFIKIPNREGEIINKTVSCSQIPATILKLIGINPPEEMEPELFSDKEIKIFSESTPLPIWSFIELFNGLDPVNGFDPSTIKRVDIQKESY